MNRRICVPSLRAPKGRGNLRPACRRGRDCFVRSITLAVLAMTFIFFGSGMVKAAPANDVADERVMKNLDDSEQNRRIDELERSLDYLEQKIDRLDERIEDMDHSLKELKRKV